MFKTLKIEALIFWRGSYINKPLNYMYLPWVSSDDYVLVVGIGHHHQCAGGKGKSALIVVTFLRCVRKSSDNLV